MMFTFSKPKEAAKTAPSWDKIDPMQEAIDLAQIAKRAADCVGLFSLFALIVVFSDIAGDKYLTWSIDAIGSADNLGLALHMPWLPFLLIGAFGVWIFNRHGLRILLTLRFADPDRARVLGFAWGGPTATPIAKTAVGVALIAFSALIVVTATKFQDGGRESDARQAAIVEETAARDRAAVQAELATVTRDLETLTQPRDDTPNFQTQAARAGAESWRARVTATPDATQRARLAAEAPTAARADALREREGALRRELSAAPVSAAVARDVDVDRGATDWIVSAFASIPLWFAVATEFLALIMKLVEVLLLRRAQAAWLAAQEAPAPAGAAPDADAALRAASRLRLRRPKPAPPAVEPESPPIETVESVEPAPDAPARKRALKALPEPTLDEIAAWRGLEADTKNDTKIDEQIDEQIDNAERAPVGEADGEREAA
jgi:hypothetical protein